MNWDIRVKGECLNSPSLYIATAVANIVSDIILFALPIHMVVNLQIPRRQKIGLLGKKPSLSLAERRIFV
jgi:hypothetical protein